MLSEENSLWMSCRTFLLAWLERNVGGEPRDVEDTARRIIEIVRENVSSGRFGRVCKFENREAGEEALRDYVVRVGKYYLEEHERVTKLQEADGLAWQELYNRLLPRAYHRLLKFGVPEDQAYEEANDYVQQACENIYRGRYTYDVPFEARAARILFNNISQRYTRQGDVLAKPRMTYSLDQPTDASEDRTLCLRDMLDAPDSLATFERVDIQELLLWAVKRLDSRSQQRVIIRSFFYDWTDGEIAAELGKSKQAVYNLRHRALKELRKILEADERKSSD